MGAAVALIFLAEAATTCAPAGSTRLKAGATVVPAIVTVQADPFDPSALTSASATDPTEPKQTGPRVVTEDPDADQAEEQQCAEPTVVAELTLLRRAALVRRG